MVKRGAMKKDHSYFESIEQAEQIKEAEQKILETQTRAMEALQKQLEKLDYDMKQIQKLTEKERALLKEKLGMEKLFKSIDNIPNFIRKKVG